MCSPLESDMFVQTCQVWMNMVGLHEILHVPHIRLSGNLTWLDQLTLIFSAIRPPLIVIYMVFDFKSNQVIIVLV